MSEYVRKCNSCKEEYEFPESWVFCPQCGKKLVNVVECGPEDEF